MIVTNKFFSLNIPRFIIGVLLIVPGAFMIADAILVRLGEGVIFFSGVNTNFEGMVGFALIILSASNLDSNR